MSGKRPTRGIILMSVAMLTIPVVDGIAKHLSSDYSPLFIGWMRYAVATLTVVPIAAIVMGRRLFPAERLASHFCRTLFLVGAMTLYFIAVARIALATAASAFLIGPIIAALLSVPILGERLSAGKLAGLACGVAGSLMIVRPADGALDPGTIFALGSGILFALYLIATRQASQASDPLQTLAFQCLVGTMLLTPQAAVTWRSPESSDVLLFAALGTSSAASHLLSIAAFRFAEASTLAPLVYLELVGAGLVGYFAFHEIPGRMTLLGGVFIVTAGLILLGQQSSERRRARSDAQAA